MIVEFVGCTGAGKTTLISKVQRRIGKRAKVTTSYELVAAPLGLKNVTHPTARNLIQELVGLPFFIRSLKRHKAFVNFNLRMLARQANFSFFTLNDLRSLERKIGVYEIIKRKERDQVILVDEGTVLQAHHLFVFTNALYSSKEIAKFSSLLPLPDLIVYVRAPVDNLIQRSLQRADPPRIMRKKDRAQNEEFIHRAVTMFEELVKTEQIQSRLLLVDNPDSGEYDTVVAKITEFILDYDPSTSGTSNSYLTAPSSP